MSEPEAVRLEEPSFACGAATTTNNFLHRRHYAVRRKLGRAKTVRPRTPLSSPTDDEPLSSPAAMTEDDAPPITTTTTDGQSVDICKCQDSNSNDGDGSDDVDDDDDDDDESDSNGESTGDDETSVEADDEEDGDKTDEDDDNDDDAIDNRLVTEADQSDDDRLPTSFRASQLLSENHPTSCPVVVAPDPPTPSCEPSRSVPVITIQPGPSSNDLDESLFDAATTTTTTITTSSRSLLCPVDERYPISSAYLTR